MCIQYKAFVIVWRFFVPSKDHLLVAWSQGDDTGDDVELLRGRA
jgi:hypothetical protein